MVERYKTKGYQQQEGLEFYQIVDTWNNDETVLLYHKPEKYKQLDIETLLNNTILWDITEILNLHHPSYVIEDIIFKHFQTKSAMNINCIYNQNQGNLLIQIEETENLDEYTDDELHNIVKNTLEVPKRDVEMINREYYYYKHYFIEE